MRLKIRGNETELTLNAGHEWQQIYRFQFDESTNQERGSWGYVK